MTTLLSDILNLATIESGEYSLEIKESNPEKIIDDTIDEYSRNFRKISFQRDLKGSKRVLIDEYAFKQVIINLIENAIKYGHI